MNKVLIRLRGAGRTLRYSLRDSLRYPIKNMTKRMSRARA